jgi:hypothetical protein
MKRIAGVIACIAISVVGTTSALGADTVTTSQLNGIACPSVTTCFAVGSYLTSSGAEKTLIERWNGATWSVVPSPSPAGLSRLMGVVCQSTSSCFAVGRKNDMTLIERWNGMTWSVVPSLSPLGTGFLNGVSCTSTYCLAVGAQQTTPTSATKTLAERWNGSSWSYVLSPVLTGSTFAELFGVACRAPLGCFSVGTGGAFPGGTLVEHWNGSTLSVVPSPNPDVGEGAELDGIWCANNTSCIAVGFNNLGGVGRPATLIERWSGSTWSIDASVNPPVSYSELRGVFCVAPNCVAVGDYQQPGSFSGSRALVERWNGTTWVIQTSPNSAGTYNSLAAVRCVSTTQCFAVGHGSSGTGAYTALIERWRYGLGWQVAVNGNP